MYTVYINSYPQFTGSFEEACEFAGNLLEEFPGLDVQVFGG